MATQSSSVNHHQPHDRCELRAFRRGNDGLTIQEVHVTYAVSTSTVPIVTAQVLAHSEEMSAPLVYLEPCCDTPSVAGALSTSESFFPSAGNSLLAPTTSLLSRPHAFSPSLRSDPYLASYPSANASVADWLSPESKIPPPSPVLRGMSPTPEMLALLESSTPFLLPPAFLDEEFEL